MKLHNALKIGAVVTAVGLLAGCSASSKPAATTGPVTITFQAYENTQQGGTATAKIVSDWNKANPKIHVNLVETPIDSAYQKISTEMSGGTAPDIIEDDVTDLGHYESQGLLENLKPLLSASVIKDIKPGPLSSAEFNGKLAGVPTELQTYVVFANTALIKAAGLQVPTGNSMSWAQFESIAKATTTGGVHGVTWGLGSPTAAFVSLGLGYGAQYFKGTGTSAKLSITSKEMAVPNQVLGLIKNGYLDPTAVSLQSADVLPTFYAGKAAMMVQGSYHIADVEADAPKSLQWTVLPPLSGSQGAHQSASPTTLSIASSTKHAAQAAQFVDFYMDATNLASLNYAEGLLPATVSGSAELKKITKGKAGWAEVVNSANDLVPAPASYVTNYQNWKSTAATPAYQQYLSQKITESQLEAQLAAGWAQVNPQ